MTKEEILKSFLEDDLIIEKGYLDKKDLESIRWASTEDNKLIEVIKFAIEGEIGGDSSNVIEKRINKYLNS